MAEIPESVLAQLASLNDDQLWEVKRYCGYKLGVFPLASLCREDVLELWRQTYEDVPRLEDYADDACERIARHWEDDGLQYAWDAAVEHMYKYAVDDDHTPVLKEHPDEAAPQWQGYTKGE